MIETSILSIPKTSLLGGGVQRPFQLPDTSPPTKRVFIDARYVFYTWLERRWLSLLFSWDDTASGLRVMTAAWPLNPELPLERFTLSGSALEMGHLESRMVEKLRLIGYEATDNSRSIRSAARWYRAR